MSTKQQVGVGCLMVVAAVVTAGLAVTLGGYRGLGGSVSYTAPIDDAAGLSKGALVAVQGVEVGTVTGLKLEAGRAVVLFDVDDDVALLASARAEVRARSLLGEKYLALELGDGEPLPEGAALPAVGPQYEIDEMVAVLTPLLEAVDPLALKRATAALAEKLEQDPELVARMLADAEQMLADAREASEELPGLARESRQAVAEARGTLSVLQARGAELEPLIRRADALLGELDAAAEPLPETVAEARAALEEVRALVRTLSAAGQDAEDILAKLDGFDRDLVREILREEGIRVRLFSSGKRD